MLLGQPKRGFSETLPVVWVAHGDLGAVLSRWGGWAAEHRSCCTAVDSPTLPPLQLLARTSVVPVTLWLPLSMDRPIGLKLLHHVFWQMIIFIVNPLLDKECAQTFNRVGLKEYHS